MEARVKEWMSGDPVAIEPEASAVEALDLMTDRGIRHLPVVDAARRVVGVVSVDDLRAALPVPLGPRQPLSPADRELAREWRVGEVMTHAPETLSCDASLAEAAERMAERRIGCLPIVDEEGRLAGLLSETDALHALATSLHLREAPARRARQAELEALVATLQSERQRITLQLDRYHDVERRLSIDPHDQPMDQAEAGADLRDVGLTASLDELAARRLEALDRALDLAAQGRLGVCDRCGGAIPLTRLQALPGTTLCVACAREAE
jgi:acetoin utilization protein AcuB